MIIRTIVEGHGEVKAVPVLIRRLLDAVQVHDIKIAEPIRRKRSEFRNRDGVHRAVRLAMLDPECGAIVVIFDADDDCPKSVAPEIQGWIEEETHGSLPCVVVMPTREYEAWFLASIESLRGKRGIRHDADSHPDPERPRGAKEQLELLMDSGSYSETRDQAPLTHEFDLRRAYCRCRSFRRMIHAFQILLKGIGREETNWPPREWKASL